MRYLSRSKIELPEAFISDAAAERKRLVLLLQSASQEKLRQLRAPFNFSIVRGARPWLEKISKNKCWYCESFINPQQGAIDHFRPRDGIGSEESVLAHLYYAWLAYDAENLMLACNRCNQVRSQNKAGMFPVTGSRALFLSSVTDCRQSEQGTMVDPSYDQPAEHLEFFDDGRCGALTERGFLTIAMFDLNRSELVEKRSAVAHRVNSTLKEFISRRFLGKISQEEWDEVVGSVLDERLPYVAVSTAVVNRFLSGDNAEVGDKIFEKSLPRYIRRGKYPGRLMLPENDFAAISRIEIRNFKSIEHLDIDLLKFGAVEGGGAPSMVLIGENGSGKSSVLEAVAMALAGTETLKKLGLNGYDFLRRNELWKPIGKPAKVHVYLSTNERVSISIDPKSGIFSGNEVLQLALVGYGPHRFFRRQIKSRRKSGSEARLKSLLEPDTSLANPSSWLLHCKERDYDAAVRALREILMVGQNGFISRPPRGRRVGRDLTVARHGLETPLERLSEGYRTTVATATDAIRAMLDYYPSLEEAHGLVLIDEIDAHLHPRWKMRVLDCMRAAMPRVHFIVTTHDPLCLRGLQDGEVCVLRRDANGSISSVPDLPNVRGLSTEQLLTSDYFGLLSTDDPATEDDLARYAELATKSNRSQEEQLSLEKYRARTMRRLRFGTTRQEQLIFDATNNFLRQEREAEINGPQTSNSEISAKIVDIWSSLKSSGSKG